MHYAYIQDAIELLIGKDLFMGDPLYAGVRHAVPAPQVAPVGDRDPYIINAPFIQIYKGRHQSSPP
jgi:hypothetical protein